MKPALLVSLSFLLFAFTTNLPTAFSQLPVLGSNGNPIFPGGKYYLKSSGPKGGGVALGVIGNDSGCPLTVLQYPYDVVDGMALNFTAPPSKDPPVGTIFTDTTIQIAFAFKPFCAKSSQWVVVGDDYPAKYVGIGTAQDHLGQQIVTGGFKIQQYDGAYKLVFCPTTGAPPNSCFNIATRQDQRANRLILTDGEPYKVKFVRVPADDAS